jgi:hypothetical protein
MRPDKFSLAKAWINDERSTPEEAKATWEAMGKEFDENRNAMLMASAESDKIKNMMNKKYGPGTMKYGSEIPQPAQREDVIQIDAINRFMRDNPMADGGRIGFKKAGVVKDRYSELMGMSLEELQELGFPGNKKTTRVTSPSGGSYSKMTDELKNWIRSQTKKENPLGKKTVQPALDRVSDQILKAHANDDIAYIVTKDAYNPIGNFSKDDFRLLNQIKNNPDSLAIVAENTGLDTDTILNLLEDRDAFLELERYSPISQANKINAFGDKQKFYKQAEKWIIRNSSRYSDPEKLKKAFIRTFGKKNHLMEAINAAKTTGVNVNFSDWFKKTILGGTPKTTYNSKLLNDIFKTSIYTNNKNVQNKILKEFEKILPEPGSKRTPDIRYAFRDSPLLQKFGLNSQIRGPIARLLAKNIGDSMLKQISMFRDPFLGTSDLIKYLSDKVEHTMGVKPGLITGDTSALKKVELQTKKYNFGAIDGMGARSADFRRVQANLKSATKGRKV